MIAHIQRLTTLSLFAAALIWAVVHLRSGHPLLAMAGALAPLAGYAGILGIEFALMVWRNRAEPAPAPTAWQVVRAWSRELAHGVIVFCWRQPFRSNRWPDKLQGVDKTRRGVVLVHGFACNRGIWNRWLARLHAESIAVVAVNLEPVLGSIEDYAETIDRACRTILEATGKPPVIVAHSMGGLAVRHWLSRSPLSPAGVITIATPHSGTWIARYAKGINGQQMRYRSQWLRSLERLEHSAGSQRASGTPFTCFYSRCDNIVMPASGATLANADNRFLRGIAHVEMVDYPAVYDELLARIDD